MATTKQSLSILKPAARYLRHNHASVFYRLEDLYRWGQDLRRFRFPLHDSGCSLLDYALQHKLPCRVFAPATELDRPPSSGLSEDMAMIGANWRQVTSEDDKGTLYMAQLRSHIRHPIEAAYRVDVGTCFVSSHGDLVLAGDTPLRIRKQSETHHSRGIDEALPVEGPVVSLLSRFATSFSHWILDSLLKLVYIPPSERAGYRYLIPDAERAFLLKYLALFGIREEQTIRVSNWVQCEALVNIEVAHRSNMPHPDALRRLRSEFDVPLFGPGHKRIFIGRRQRCLDNEEEIVRIAGDFGFERHYLEDLSLREQIRLFSQAECITGYHGAGFVNMIYAPKDCQVVEILNPAKWDHAYVRIAAALRFKHWHACVDYHPGVWDGHMDPGRWAKLLQLIFKKEGGHETHY